MDASRPDWTTIDTSVDEQADEVTQADRDMLESAIGEAYGAFALGMDGPDGLTSEEWDDVFAD